MRVINVFEANIAQRIKDPKIVKQIFIAMRHDGTIPKHALAKLGTKPTEEQTLHLWSQLLDSSLRSTRYGDVSADGKFDDWLTRLYINGQADYEDISGEGGDALGAWKALSIRGKLAPQYQDFNKFRSIKQIQQIVSMREYRDELRRIADAEVIEKHKRERKEIVLIDNPKYLVTLPLNYGSCYTFNNSTGYQANFCTGSSSGLTWFNRYAPDGPVISIVDKAKVNEVEGKWQLHAATHQLVDADQTRRHDVPFNDERFSRLFPGLMSAIGHAMTGKAEEIHEASKEITSGRGYDVAKEVSKLQTTYPLSWASQAAEEPEEQDGEGTWLVKHIESGKTARIQGLNRQDVEQKLVARHPNVNLGDFEFKLEPAQQQPTAEGIRRKAFSPDLQEFIL